MIDEDEPREKQGQGEDDRRRRPDERPEHLLGLPELGDRRPAEERGRGDQDHGAVDAPADDHGDERVGELVLELTADDRLVAQVPLPALDDLRVQEDVVGHDHGAEHGHDDGQ